MAIAAIPAVVIVSVLNNMYSVTTQTGRRIMVTLAVFFIIFIQVSRGLRQSQPTQLELMRSYAATPREVMRKVRIPNAMAYLFTGIRTAAPIAVIIALVSEYFGGTQDGLGQKIAANFSLSKSAFALRLRPGGIDRRPAVPGGRKSPGVLRRAVATAPDHQVNHTTSPQGEDT